jgi:limonene-1,2-epoxide hydrolase
MAYTWPNKDPDEILDYSVDWSRFLGGATIFSVSWFIHDAEGVKTSVSDVADTTVNNLTVKYTGITNTSTVATIRLADGTNNVSYKITCQVTDTNGLITERVVKLRIKEN